MKKHWSEVLACSLCGKRFRSVGAEAHHRHNAPLMCAPKKKGRKQIVAKAEGRS
jgi:hypothetical protein